MWFYKQENHHQDNEKSNVNKIFIKHDMFKLAELWQVSDCREENEPAVLCAAQWQEVACLQIRSSTPDAVAGTPVKTI